MAPVPCTSNSDCPEPTGVCDQVKAVCVECLELSDCGHMQGTVCDQGHCNCPHEATWCGPNDCVDTETSPDDCGQCGFTCFGACAAGVCVDPWVPVSTDDAPTPRARHVAQWTGTHMVVWGGMSSTSASATLRDGGIYDPSTREWVPTSLVGAPSPRQRAASVWAEDRLIVWGGLDGSTYLADGGIFDPATNTWEPMSVVGAPVGRIHHTAVWTGTEMIVFGGQDDASVQLNSGGRYNLSTDAWTATASMASPGETRRRHTAIWDGSNMVVYGGFGDVGTNLGVYMPAVGAPGGRTYDPVANAWGDATTLGEPSPRSRHSAVHDGIRMLLFGGYNGTTSLGQGFKLDSGTWAAFTGTAPSARRDHTAVWLGDAGVMVVWGGVDDAAGVTGTGGVYAVASNSWTKPTPLALEERQDHSAVSTGSTMIVWGGFDAVNTALGDGGVYTP